MKKLFSIIKIALIIGLLIMACSLFLSIFGLLLIWALIIALLPMEDADAEEIDIISKKLKIKEHNQM